ncbi:ABC transporter permease subunit [Vibrio sp. JC009]|uniref:ABC transporter permease subunit n=1 Tax=Vibrio sp. JC009 TaxID=2912314 RepID=UPI0023AECE80|nr:ABC transporter permease subunit [Vibrio sp. JC009]WED22322.1 ABC transporter permease subunit [Vibrio sp. JC009]
MPQAEFSLKERDRTRYIKDRVARTLVTSGGVTVLLALVLIFFYLISIVLPVFSGASLEKVADYSYQQDSGIVAMGVDNYGENLFLFDNLGSLSYISLDADKADKPKRLTSLLSSQVIDSPSAFSPASSAMGWYGYGSSQGAVVAVRPKFNVSFTNSGKVLTPDLESFLDGREIVLDQGQQALKHLALAVNDELGIFAGITESGATVAKEVKAQLDNKEQVVSRALIVPQLPQAVSKIILSPDGKQLFALSENELIVAVRKRLGFMVRDIIDLSKGEAEKAVLNIKLLAGAQSLLVSHADNTVSQWFDVLNEGQRYLTFIRSLDTDKQLANLLPNSQKKGFLSFHQSGVIEGHYTTSESRVFSDKLLDKTPDLAALSVNEKFLATLSDNRVTLFSVDNPHPEISFKSLWRKVWYENYPEPEYVWQSTAASDEYEAKFSFVPITFGTLKAALFCMLISTPIAVLGAIYTAYFMTPAMRRVVKPSIELMEALPTVIIGFLAGMWLAPIVERHLPAVFILFVMLPLFILLVGALWTLIPRHVMDKLPNGWHALILIPVTLIVIVTVLNFSDDLEMLLFSGDIRVYLAQYGIDFDQRNALVIGIAMGFAVIPSIFTIAEDAVFSVPKHLSDGSLALGATHWQTLTRVVLLTASPGIFSAVMIGLGRAVGETMIVLMATGNTPVLDWNVLEGMRTLSATIAVEMPESEVGSTHYRLLFLSALILFVFTFAVNSLAEMVRHRLRVKYSSM